MENQMNCNYCDNYLLDTLKRIDKMQKEAIISAEGTCVTCQSLLLATNNTLPLSIVSRCSGSYLTLNIGLSAETTTYFRIESIRCDRYVTLRLLSFDEETSSLSATPYTATFDIECICGIQCYEPITTEACNLKSL